MKHAAPEGHDRVSFFNSPLAANGAARWLLAGLIVACISGPMLSVARAQETLAAPVGARVAYALDTGVRGNEGDEWAAVYERTIAIPNASWLRLHFSRARLAPGSFVLVTSLRDGEVHRLEASDLANWKNSTAYMNGDRLDVRLIAAPGSRENRLVIEEIEAGMTNPALNANESKTLPTTRGDSNQCGICGTDDRTPSTQTWSGRIMPAGCTGSVICEDSTVISAGHCVQANQVIQFNVPASTPGPNNACNLVNPPVADQFPIQVVSSVNGGVGNDWAVYRSGVNSLNQKAFQRYGQLKRLASAPASGGAATEIFGYGVDLTCAVSQTQRRSLGTIATRQAEYYTYNNDVRGGNSGSAFLANDKIIGVVTHCSSCNWNIATRIDVPAFANAINAVMACDDGIAVSYAALGSPLGTTFTVAPPDIDGVAGGAPPFTRRYLPGTVVTVTASAPSIGEPPVFTGWRWNGVDMGLARALTFAVTAPTTARASYSGVCWDDRDDGSGTGTPDASITIDDLLYFLNRYEAGANAADLDDGSMTAVGDGAVDINDMIFFLVHFEAGC